MHEGRVRRVYERRRLLTKPLSPPWMWELKRNFPHKAGQFMLGPSFSLSPLFFPLSSSSTSSTSPPPSLQSGVCLMKLSREGSLSFCLAATHYTPLASNALFRRELCVVPPSASVSTYSPCLFHDSRDQPFQHFSPTLLVALPFLRSFTWKSSWYHVE